MQGCTHTNSTRFDPATRTIVCNDCGATVAKVKRKPIKARRVKK